MINISNVENSIVTIIMPCYNSEATIKKSIESVINQTFKNWQLLIIDDYSEDTTLEIIKLFVSDDRIKLIKKSKNTGVSISRNIGIKKAKSKYIAFLDADDLWEKTKLEKQIVFMEGNECQFSFTGASYITSMEEKFKGTFSVPEKVNYNQLRWNNVISTSSVIIKTSLLKDKKMISEDLHEDFLLWLTILRDEKIYSYGLNEPLLIYRFSKKSKSSNKLKSFSMTYKVYRNLSLPIHKAFIFTISHLFHATNKYRKIIL